MEDFHINTSQDKSFDYDSDYSNITYLTLYDSYGEVSPMFVFTYIIIAVGLLLTLMAICAVCSLVRKDHVVPIYVINLLISDLIQFCCLFLLATGLLPIRFSFSFYLISLTASIGFMVCIALERYLVIACPLWYRFRHTIKFSVVLCVVVWVFSLVLCVIIMLTERWYGYISKIVAGTFLLLPLPLFIFFLGGTIRALSASRVPSDEKRRIVGILVLVLLIYTLLFMPAIIFSMTEMYRHDHVNIILNLIYVFVMLSPIADLFLYVFMRKGTIDKLLASVCCCRMDSNDSSRMDSNDVTSSTV